MVKRLCKPLISDSFFLFGARGVGKSTFISQQFLGVAEGTCWTIDLLNDDQFERYLRRPSLIESDLEAFESKPEWVFIDEVQRLPELLNHVHRLIEKKKQKFILSGSSARKLKKLGSNLLAGRAFVNSLFPLTHLELGPNFSLERVLHWGSLPKILNATPEQGAAFLRSYIQVYMKEEILFEQWIRDLEPFHNFLEVGAQMNGKIVNFSKIAKEVGVDPKTLVNYYSILEDTYLGFFLPAFHQSVRKQQASHPKFYFFDLGVKRALERVLNDRFSPGSYAFGDAFEHFVIAEFYRLNQYFQKDFKLSFFRTKEGREIDLILSRSRKTYLIEIKSRDRVDFDEVKKFKLLAAEFSGAEAYYLSRDPTPTLEHGVRCLPWAQGLKEILAYD